MHALPRIQSHLTVRTLAGEAVVYDPRSRATHRLNATALTIWRWCAEARGSADVARRLTATFEVDAAQAEADVRATIDALYERGLTDGLLLS